VADREAEERLAGEAPEEHLRRREFLQRTALTAGLASSFATALDPDVLVAEAARRQRRGRLPSPRNLPIDTIVVLMMENRSFDHYLGWLPNADGRQAGLSYVDEQGVRLSTRAFAPDFQGCAYTDPSHSWDGGRQQLNGGRMDGFLRGRNDQFALSYYREQDLGFIPAAARAFTAYDRFFCSLLGPTYPNRYYMHAATAYGRKNNAFPSSTAGLPDTTIFAALARAGVSARCFFNDLPPAALWGVPGLARSSRVEEYFLRCELGSLPSVSYVDPSFLIASSGTSGDDHPHADVRIGQAFISDVVHAFMESRHWRRGALFIVYDEWGGFFDHVRPPRVPDDRSSRDHAEDFGQMGMRIPAVAVSPYARAGHVDHGVYGFESILKFIRYRFGIRPLTRRDAYANNIGRSLDWSSPPRDPPELPDPTAVVRNRCQASPASMRGEDGAPLRPKPHDFEQLLTSGYLERLGFNYRAATASSTFRLPSTIESLLKAG
jgi:phospholipase C